MADVIWTSSAFKVLEALPEPIAFGIFRQTEYLQRFPEIGAQISQLKHLSKYRQLIYKKKYRIIYRFDNATDSVRIIHLQNCRQKLPTARQTKRSLKDEGGLPLE